MSLKHVVLFAFADHVDRETKAETVRRFVALQHSVPGIEALEWGVSSGSEGLDHGHSHAFVLTFASDAARDAYLVHPEHQAFADWVKPHLVSVTVVDYWAKTVAEPASSTTLS